MDDFRNDKDGGMFGGGQDWSSSSNNNVGRGSSATNLNAIDWSLLGQQQAVTADQLSELSGGNPRFHGMGGLSMDHLHLDSPQIAVAPSNPRTMQSSRHLLRSGSDMTASRRDRNKDMMMSPMSPYAFESPALQQQFNHHAQSAAAAAAAADDKLDLTRSQYEKLKTTIRLLSDQIKDIHEVLQKLMPVLKQILTGPKEEISKETVQGMLDQLLPRIEENLSQHLHNVQNKVLMNIQSSMDNQESKYQQLCQQVTYLNGGLARRDQEVLETLGQLSEVISAKENYFDFKMEEMKQEMNKRLADMEGRLAPAAEGAEPAGTSK